VRSTARDGADRGTAGERLTVAGQKDRGGDRGAVPDRGGGPGRGPDGDRGGDSPGRPPEPAGAPVPPPGAAGPAPDAEDGAAESGNLADSLLRTLLADPHHLPEHLALFALRHMGPLARRSLERHRARSPGASADELRLAVVTRGHRDTVTEGAFVGGPFLLLVPVAFCAALLNQARTVLELAGLDGRDPTSPERAAELLVLLGVYENVTDAAAALAALDAAGAPPRRSLLRPKALWAVTLRMARLLGLVTPREESEPTGLRKAAVVTGRVLLLVLVFVVGLVAPLVWLPYMAVSYHRATGRLTDRAARFYFDKAPGLRAARRARGLSAASLRAGLSALPPLLLTLLVVLAGTRLHDARWPVLGAGLFLASLATGAFWYLRRSRRAADGDGGTGNGDGTGDGGARQGGTGPGGTAAGPQEGGRAQGGTAQGGTGDLGPDRSGA
jgi:hypothetical protein